MRTAEEIQGSIEAASRLLGHDGFIYLYILDGSMKAVGSVPLSTLAPLLLKVLIKK